MGIEDWNINIVLNNFKLDWININICGIDEDKVKGMN